MGRKRKDEEKEKINAFIENDSDPFINDEEKGLDEKFGIEPIDPKEFEPDEIKIDEIDENYNDFSIIFSIENKIYKNVYNDYQEMRERMKRSLHNLETIMNKLKQHILTATEPSPKLYDVYSKLSDSFESLTRNIDKQNKEMIKTQINNFKEKMILMFKYMDSNLKKEETSENVENGLGKKTMKEVMEDINKIEKNVENSNKKGLF